MSMLKADKSLLGFRYTKWHDCPASAVSNGRARAVHTYSDAENVIYSYSWPMDGGKFNIAGGYVNGLQFQIDPATPPVPAAQVWKTNLKGFLEDSAIHFHRFVKFASENTFFPDGLEVEVYVYYPIHTAFKDYMVILFHFRNVSESQINFKLGIFTADYLSYGGTEKYVHPDYSALVKSDEKTIVWGSDTAPEDCYMDGAWRTADYSDATPNSNWLRQNITLNASAEKLLAFIIIYGDSESSALSNYRLTKTWNHKELLQKELRFWKTAGANHAISLRQIQ